MDFSEALIHIKAGARMCREDDEPGVAVFLVQGSQFAVNRAPLNEFYPDGTLVNYRPHLDRINMDGTVGNWAPSHEDLLAEDWRIAE